MMKKGALALALLLATAARAGDNPLIYGVHDAACFPALQGKIGWVVESVTVQGGDDPLGYLRPIAAAGVTLIVRVNNGYGTDGTIPLVGAGKTYGNDGDFANAVADMARKSPHVTHWIVGNEPNLDAEWPRDASGTRVPLSVETYFACYSACYDAIKAVRPDALVMPAAVAPYEGDLGTGDGDSIAYFAKLMKRCVEKVDAIALHAYTHGQDPALASDEARMSTLPDMHFNFRVYRDFLAALPDALKAKPVYVTECDPGHYSNQDTGWVKAIFHEAAAWNAQAGTQKIRCVCLYRWSDTDPGYGLEKLPAVQQDLAEAASEGTTSPQATNGIVQALDGAAGSAASTASPPPAAPTSASYTLDFGDTLSEIAGRAGLTVDQLLDFKGDSDTTNRDRLAASSPMTGSRKRDLDLVFPGQKVLVPAPSP
jgi:hypothetical protein